MQGIMQQLAMLSSQADETDEERARRIEAVAEQTEADPETLYEVEEALRGLGWSVIADYEEEVTQFENKIASSAQFVGMDPQKVKSQFGAGTILRLLTMKCLGGPEEIALTVAHIHGVFERKGFYDEVDVDVDRIIEEGR